MEFEEAMMIRAAVQGNELARKWLSDLYVRTDGRDGYPPDYAWDRKDSK